MMNKFLGLVCMISVCALFCSCSENSSQTESVNDYSSAETITELSETNDSDEAGISGTEEQVIDPERKKDNTEELVKTAEELLELFNITGNKNDNTAEDYDRYMSAYPDFYIDEFNNIILVNGQTRESYMNVCSEMMKVQCGGEDYRMYADGVMVQQYSDSSLLELCDGIRRTFGNDISIQDAFNVHLTEITEGSSGVSEEKLDLTMIEINGSYYLYDQFIENMK